MKNRFNARNLIIMMLCITIICMGIGFAYLSVKLENKNKEKPVFDVSFTKVLADTPVKGGIAAPTGTKEIINDGKTLKFNFSLSTPHDELAYTIVVKNMGTLPAKITEILTYPDYLGDAKSATTISPVSITHNDLDGKILEPDEELEIKLVVSYDVGANAGQMTVPYQMTIIATSTNK